MNSLEIAAPEISANPSEIAQPANSGWRDLIGIVASIGCAIHCAAMPFVLAYLPALGLSFLADEAFHKWMALFCFLIAMVAFVPGLRRHRSWVPISIGAVGLALITYAAFGLADQCCASCGKASSTAANVQNSGSSAAGAALTDGSKVETESNCCDDDCEHCSSASATSGEGTVGDPAESDKPVTFLSLFAPWVTPLGGLILVTAHLLNRRYGYQCSCCEATPVKVPAAKTI